MSVLHIYFLLTIPCHFIVVVRSIEIFGVVFVVGVYAYYMLNCFSRFGFTAALFLLCNCASSLLLIDLVRNT